VGQGTTFTMRIPLGALSESEENRAA
jgi:hypothetical protein